jgi:hypothetical protein
MLALRIMKNFAAKMPSLFTGALLIPFISCARNCVCSHKRVANHGCFKMHIPRKSNEEKSERFEGLLNLARFFEARGDPMRDLMSLHVNKNYSIDLDRYLFIPIQVVYCTPLT